ncbi:amino acid transporter [Halobacillus andaensis]|uniref:Amino acid transporter n=1 Tax=Halobacillus andaensis TaxID=1176239 RepID=A0A917B2G2_HALAA|nr:LysE family transporter [Halobacillus andaensis]MBP2004843.1 threonine/homoserine/homoserine lactone efflux protein [Halobacillus andaensis]GGF18483.1 amino acid transporter [Halobacillus andaensis]
MILLLIRQIVLGLSLAAPIGPINIEIIRRGIYQGFWPSLLVGAGGMTTDLALMYLVYRGLSDYLTLNAVQLTLLVFGALVLTYTGIQSFLNRPEPVIDSSDHRGERFSPGLLRPYLTGISIAAFNPLNILFWLGIYGSVLSDSLQDENVLRAFYINSAIFIGIGLWNVNLALTVHFSKSLLKPGALKLISLTASLFLIGLGVYFAFKAVVKVTAFF